MAILSRDQETFLTEYLINGDEKLTCQRTGVTALRLVGWEGDPYFLSQKKLVERSFLRKLEREIARQGLLAVQQALKFGEKTVSLTKGTREAIDQTSGEIVSLSSEKLTTKTVKHPVWAVREAMRIFMIQKVEDSVAEQFRGLADNGMLPDDIRDNILMILESKDAEIRNLISGGVSANDITEELLAEVQAMVVG